MDTNETKVFIAILVAVIILAIILIFFFVNLINYHRKRVALYEKQLDKEITVLEAERKRVASDLHDDLGPFLSSIKLQINLLNTKDEEDVASIKEISLQIDGIVEKVRETSNNLMPNVLIRKGLMEAINNFLSRINRGKNLRINASLCQNLNLSEEKQIHVYRLFQEIVHNALKHSAATELNVRLEIKNDKLHLSIEDNGKGFDFEKMSKESVGFGLKSISSRVDILKGDIFLDTKPGHGVRYAIVIPL